MLTPERIITKQELFEHIKKVIWKNVLFQNDLICLSMIFHPDNSRATIFARQLIMYFSFKYEISNKRGIAKLCETDNHTLVIHAIKVINNYIDTNPFRRKLINELDDLINNCQVPDYKSENIELKKRVKELEDEIFKLQCRISNQHIKKGESIQPYHGYTEHN